MLDALRKLSTVPRHTVTEPQPSCHADGQATQVRTYKESNNPDSSLNSTAMSNYNYSYSNYEQGGPQLDSKWIDNVSDAPTYSTGMQGISPDDKFSYYYNTPYYHPLSPLSPVEDNGGKKRRMSGNIYQEDNFQMTLPSKARITPPHASYESYGGLNTIPNTPMSSTSTLDLDTKTAMASANITTPSIQIPKTPLKAAVVNPYLEFTPKTPTYAKPTVQHELAQAVQPLRLHQPKVRVPQLHSQIPSQQRAFVPHTYSAPQNTAKTSVLFKKSSRTVEPWKPNDVVLPLVIDTTQDYTGDDEQGHYQYQIGELFAGRYTILKLLGQGTYAKVLQAWDNRQNEYCAVKIIKGIPKYREASKIELRVFTLLNRQDPTNQYKCVQMRGCFDYRNHVCIVTDLHDMSIYDFLKSNSFMPFPGYQVVSFARQLLKSIAYVHSLGLVHTDLKPENMLLKSSSSSQGKHKRPRSRTYETRRELVNTEITLIDFGSSVFNDEYHPSIVSTRHYRAPEVVLGLEWTSACDMWSIACVLVELCTGRVLFETRDNLEHLHMMQRALCSTFSSKQLALTEYSSTGAPDLVTWSAGSPTLAAVTNADSQEKISNAKSIPQFLKRYVSLSQDKTFWTEFLDFIYKLMVFDPDYRLTAEQALKHPWLCH